MILAPVNLLQAIVHGSRKIGRKACIQEFKASGRVSTEARGNELGKEKIVAPSNGDIPPLDPCRTRVIGFRTTVKIRQALDLEMGHQGIPNRGDPGRGTLAPSP